MPQFSNGTRKSVFYNEGGPPRRSQPCCRRSQPFRRRLSCRSLNLCPSRPNSEPSLAAACSWFRALKTSKHRSQSRVRYESGRPAVSGERLRFNPVNRRFALTLTFEVKSRSGATVYLWPSRVRRFRSSEPEYAHHATFPHPPYRTGPAQFMHPALGEGFTRSPRENCGSALCSRSSSSYRRARTRTRSEPEDFGIDSFHGGNIV